MQVVEKATAVLMEVSSQIGAQTMEAKTTATCSLQCSTPTNAAVYLRYHRLFRGLRVRQEDLQPTRTSRMNSHGYFPALEAVWVARVSVAEPPRHSRLRVRNRTMNLRIASLLAVAGRWLTLEGLLETLQESAKGLDG